MDVLALILGSILFVICFGTMMKKTINRHNGHEVTIFTGRFLTLIALTALMFCLGILGGINAASDHRKLVQSISDSSILIINDVEYVNKILVQDIKNYSQNARRGIKDRRRAISSAINHDEKYDVVINVDGIVLEYVFFRSSKYPTLFSVKGGRSKERGLGYVNTYELDGIKPRSANP